MRERLQYLESVLILRYSTPESELIQSWQLPLLLALCMSICCGNFSGGFELAVPIFGFVE